MKLFINARVMFFLLPVRAGRRFWGVFPTRAHDDALVDKTALLMKLMRGLRDRSKREPSAPRADFFAREKKKKKCRPAWVGMTVGCLMAARRSLSYVVLVTLAGCSHNASADRSSITLLIESNPTNLDPRFATDGQSQHLDGLIFSSLVERDEQMNLRGDLAESWEAPDP